MRSFTHFKEDFYARVRDLSLFDCCEINLLKVVLDGLKVNYSQKGKIRPYLFYPKFLFLMLIRIRSRRTNRKELDDCLRKLKAHAGKKILISDVGRVYPAGRNGVRSSYFENIITHLGKKNIVHILDTVMHDGLDHDSALPRLRPLLYDPAIYPEYQALRADVLATFRNIRRSGIFSKEELKNIKIAFHLFLEEFILWNEILKNLPSLEKCYFVCHYHKEGQIYSLKKKGVSCIELQHGLIAPQDIFYLFPEPVIPFRKKILVADKILVFGPYWKDLLLKGAEYGEEQIEVIGYFMYTDSHKEEVLDLKHRLNDKTVILVTSQTFLHNPFISFIKSLCEQELLKQQNILIILKPHPSEDIRLYSGELSDSDQVMISETPLSVLFQVASVHVSIYSTSLYDAIRYGVRNYVFKAPGYEDYVEEILSAGIAEEIKDMNVFIQGLSERSGTRPDALRYYSPFNKSLL